MGLLRLLGGLKVICMARSSTSRRRRRGSSCERARVVMRACTSGAAQRTARRRGAGRARLAAQRRRSERRSACSGRTPAGRNAAEPRRRGAPRGARRLPLPVDAPLLAHASDYLSLPLCLCSCGAAGCAACSRHVASGHARPAQNSAAARPALSPAATQGAWPMGGPSAYELQ
jgi:hypothetical protein